MESLRVQRRRPRTKHGVLTTGGQHDYYIDPRELNQLVGLLAKAGTKHMRPLILSLLTKKELADITRRVQIAEMVMNGLTYDEIRQRTGSAKNTISFVKNSLQDHDRVIAKLMDPGLIQSSVDQYLSNRLRRGK